MPYYKCFYHLLDIANELSSPYGRRNSFLWSLAGWWHRVNLASSIALGGFLLIKISLKNIA